MQACAPSKHASMQRESTESSAARAAAPGLVFIIRSVECSIFHSSSAAGRRPPAPRARVQRRLRCPSERGERRQCLGGWTEARSAEVRLPELPEAHEDMATGLRPDAPPEAGERVTSATALAVPTPRRARS